LEDILANKVYLTNDEAKERLTVSFSETLSSEDIASQYIYVGEDIFNYYLETYTTNTSRVYVDEYSYLNDVITSLTNKKYDSLSGYRAGSTEYDPSKQVQRAVLLIASLAILAIEFFVYYIFGYLFEKSKFNEDRTLYLLGCSISNLKKTSLMQILFANVLGLILGMGLYLIVSILPIPLIKDINLYLRFYHFLIVIGLSLILSVLIFFRYTRGLNKNMKKGAAE
jgi:ABC-type lipoprotein release transport system permease subunit